MRVLPIHRRASLSRSAHARRGLALVETAMATVIIGGLMIAALTSVSSASAMRRSLGERAIAIELAADLMDEIRAVQYDTQPNAFGLDAGKTSSAARTSLTSIDDYNGFTEATIRRRDGTTIPNLTGWSRSVTVVWIDPANPTATSATDQGAEKITVKVKRNSRELASLSAIRCRTWDAARR